MSGWVEVAQKLPAQYRDVPVQLECGAQRVGRVNNNGVWLMASYQKCKHQYVGAVARWFDVPSPPGNGQ